MQAQKDIEIDGTGLTWCAVGAVAGVAGVRSAGSAPAPGPPRTCRLRSADVFATLGRKSHHHIII